MEIAPDLADSLATGDGIHARSSTWRCACRTPRPEHAQIPPPARCLPDPLRLTEPLRRLDIGAAASAAVIWARAMALFRLD